jgi:hypothetical protein
LETRGKRERVVLLLVVRNSWRRGEPAVLNARLLERTRRKDPLVSSLLKPRSSVGAAAPVRLLTGRYGHMRVVFADF